MTIIYACLILNRLLQSAVPREDVLGVFQPPLVVGIIADWFFNMLVLGGESILE